MAGLIAAKELSAEGIDVTVYEEHREIGVPEKCDGLVSSAGLSELGLVPPFNVVQNRLTKAVFFSPSLTEVQIDARKQNVIVLDRSRFDKYLAEKAAKAGAKLEVGKRITDYSQTPSGVTISTETGEIKSEILLDCSGYESYIRSGGKTVQGAQYLVYGSWFEKSTVEVYVNPEIYPSFFAWVIPISSDVAKIGIGGEGINTFQALNKFAREKGATIFRKMAAPIACYGTLKSFVDGKIVRAGDSAGQAKPTTGGGIYTGGYGGLLAGQAAVKAVTADNSLLLQEYESLWRSKFAKEFRFQLYVRNAFSKMNPSQVDKLFEMISSSDLPRRISDEGDFDRHSVALIKAFGLSKIVAAFGIFFSNELRDLLGI